MRKLSLENIISACRGDYYGDTGLLRREISAVTTDSRKIEPGCLFAAIKGERVDGHDFIPAVMEAGAICAIGEVVPEGLRPFIKVRNTVSALQDIAEFYRMQFDIPIIGVTGSVGKTTAKEMLASVLAQKYCVHKTAGNFNNELGVPLTVFGLREEHTAAVIEMGISHFGEMSLLTRIVKPDHGLFTVIGHAHLEFLGDRAGVLRAKSEMVECLTARGKVFCSGDDDMLVSADFVREKITYGMNENCAVRAENIAIDSDGCAAFTLRSGERSFPVILKSFGEHLISAALAAAAVGMELGLTDAQIAAGIAAYEPVGSRSRLIKTGKISIIDDCYNSNPSSLASSLRSLSRMAGRKVALIGDMLELGENAAALHADCGALAKSLGIEVITLGALSTHAAAAAGGRHFQSREALIAALPELIHEGDCVLVKASHSMHFEELSEVLKAL